MTLESGRNQKVVLGLLEFASLTRAPHSRSSCMNAETPACQLGPRNTIVFSAEPSKECSRAEKRRPRPDLSPHNIQQHNDSRKRLLLTLLQSSLPIVHSMKTSLRDTWKNA